MRVEHWKFRHDQTVQCLASTDSDRISSEVGLTDVLPRAVRVQFVKTPKPAYPDEMSIADTSGWRHEPEGYDCPFCENIATGRGAFPVEMIHTYDDVVVKMNPRWKPTNPGAALVIPVNHYENIYELPDELGEPIQRAVRETALAMKTAYGCDGISTRQHNEPAGNQDVWHFHIHVFPRFTDDKLDVEAKLADRNEVHRFAQMLRENWPT